MFYIDCLVRDIAEYKTVAAFGLLFSETAALDLQIKLAYSNKFIITSLDDQKQEYIIENADENTLIIVFSNSGDFIKKNQLSEICTNRKSFNLTKAKVVVITSNPAVISHAKVSYCILYKNSEYIQNYRIMYQVITDIISYRYSLLIK